MKVLNLFELIKEENVCRELFEHMQDSNCYSTNNDFNVDKDIGILWFHVKYYDERTKYPNMSIDYLSRFENVDSAELSFNMIYVINLLEPFMVDVPSDKSPFEVFESLNK